MYPFARFTEMAKKVLTLAQEEAERSHHSYIGTEHLLLGLLRQEEGVAATALNHLGVEIATVRSTIDSVLGRNQRIIIQQLIPTNRVKKVIEISFEEARRMGNNYVGTEHLLLGLLIEGEGIAAHVLHDLGADLDGVRAEIARISKETPPERATGEAGAGRGARRGVPGHFESSVFRPSSGEARFGRKSSYGEAIGRAAQRLADEQHTTAGPEHVLLAALDTDPLVGRMLAALGIDEAKLAEMRRIATPPESLVELRRTVHDRTVELGAWHEFPPGAIHDVREAGEAYARGRRPSDAEREELSRLREELEEAERRWRVGEDLTG